MKSGLELKLLTSFLSYCDNVCDVTSRSLIADILEAGEFAHVAMIGRNAFFADIEAIQTC